MWLDAFATKHQRTVRHVRSQLQQGVAGSVLSVVCEKGDFLLLVRTKVRTTTLGAELLYDLRHLFSQCVRFSYPNIADEGSIGLLRCFNQIPLCDELLPRSRCRNSLCTCLDLSSTQIKHLDIDRLRARLHACRFAAAVCMSACVPFRGQGPKPISINESTADVSHRFFTRRWGPFDLTRKCSCIVANCTQELMMSHENNFDINFSLFVVMAERKKWKAPQNQKGKLVLDLCKCRCKWTCPVLTHVLNLTRDPFLLRCGTFQYVHLSEGFCLKADECASSILTCHHGRFWRLCTCVFFARLNFWD